MITILFLLGITVAAETPREGPWPPASYGCVKTKTPIDVDGQLESTWETAEWTDLFIDIEGDRQPRPRFDTRAKMLWDDEYFYFAAHMDEPHLWATLRERDSVIYYDNDFEVFIDPDGDSFQYSELELNAFNTVWDLLLIRPYRDGGPAIHAWDIPGLKTAVHLDGTVNDPSDVDRSWSVEIAIPFAVLSETTHVACPPNPGDRWRVNFSRVQWRLDVVDGGYQKSTDERGKSLPENNWVWSSQREIAMHEPEHWGLVEFQLGAGPKPHPSPLDAAAWHLRWASYHLAAFKDQPDGYPLEFEIPAASTGPSLPGSWTTSYWSDGVRYTLEVQTPLGTVRLTENGRLSAR